VGGFENAARLIDPWGMQRVRGHQSKGGRSPPVQAKGKRESVAVAAMGRNHPPAASPARLKGASSRSSRIHTIDWDGAGGRPAVRAPDAKKSMADGVAGRRIEKGPSSFLSFRYGDARPLSIPSICPLLRCFPLGASVTEKPSLVVRGEEALTPPQAIKATAATRRRLGQNPFCAVQ
jgi:hypothetical protein